MPRIKVFAFLLLTLLIPSQQVLAQNSLETASIKYKSEYTNYRNSQENYLKSKSAYKAYQTVASKNDAFLKTKNYLNQVDSLYLSYFDLLIETLKSKDIKNNETLFMETENLINSEIKFLLEHRTRIESAKNLEELPPLAQELKLRLEKDGSITSTLSIAVTDYLETTSLFNEFGDISALIQNQIDTRGDASNSLFQNWKSELGILNNESRAGIDAARNSIDKKTIANNRVNYEEISISLDKVRTRMARASKLFEEIIKVI